jgi:hypothetical protein
MFVLLHLPFHGFLHESAIFPCPPVLAALYPRFLLI